MRPILVCNGCDREMHCALDREGIPYCGPCYAGLHRSRCSTCGAGIRHTSMPGPTLCYRCEKSLGWKGKPCSRCGEPAITKGVFRDGKVFCGRCQHHAEPYKTCSYCGRISQRVHKSLAAGLTELACQRCINHSKPVCGVCLARRKLVGQVDGREACTACCRRGTLLDGTCPNCNCYGVAAGTAQCRGCKNLRQAKAFRRKCLATLTQDWVQKLFQQFTEDSGLPDKPGQVQTLMKRNLEGFQLRRPPGFE